MPDPTELRRLPRYQIQLPLLYKTASAESKFGVGWTRNLSEGGALVELDQHVQPDTPLHLSLRTDTGSIEIEARVTWADPAPQDGGDVLHNLEFTQIDSGHLQALCDLLLPLSMVPHAGVRLPLDIPVSCRHKGRQGPVIKGRTGDVDRRGLLLRLPKGIPPGTPLALTLHTMKGTVMIEGQVVWAENQDAAKTAELFKHGVRFTSPSWSVSLALGLLLAEPH